jgi:hypothetical protein
LVTDLAHIDGEHLAAGSLDAGHNLVLHPQGPHQAVKVGSDDYVCPASLHGFYGLA